MYRSGYRKTFRFASHTRYCRRHRHSSRRAPLVKRAKTPAGGVADGSQSSLRSRFISTRCT
jgi:hypothetical protein